MTRQPRRYGEIRFLLRGARTTFPLSDKVSGDRRRLALVLRKIGIDARPARRRGDPDRGLGRGDAWIVERARPHEQKVRPLLGFAEQGGAALRAKAALHVAAAIGLVVMPAHFAFDMDRIGGEADVHGRAAGAKILT